MSDQAVLAALSAGVARSDNARSLSVIIHTPNLLRMLATTGKPGPYYRTSERRRAASAVRRQLREDLTGADRPAGTKVASAVPSLKGTFETTKRPDGSAAVTWNYLPSYRYVADRLGVALGDHQDGWFASSSNVPARAGDYSSTQRLEGEMQPGMIGLGRLGANLTRRPMQDGHEAVVFDVNADSVRQLESDKAGREVDAETVPLRDPQYYQFDIDTAEVAEVWRRGSVVASWLLDLTASALGKSSDLGGYFGRVSESGEGRWTVAAAVDVGVLANVRTTAMYERFSSRGEAGFGDQLLSAMRYELGGYVEKEAGV